MKIINGTAHTEKRRLLRKKQTPEEEFIWKMLRGRKTGLKWRRQVSIGVYVADFYCAEKRIVLELDGSQHQKEKAREYDTIRDDFFKGNDISVIRVSNTELNSDPSIIFERIEKVISLTPLHASGEGGLPQARRVRSDKTTVRSAWEKFFTNTT